MLEINIFLTTISMKMFLCVAVLASVKNIISSVQYFLRQLNTLTYAKDTLCVGQDNVDV